MQPLPISVRRLWRAVALLLGLITFGALATADIATDQLSDDSLPGPLLMIPIISGLAIAGFGWWFASARWRSWGYEVTDKWIAAKWGIFSQRVATVPRNRVQTVTTSDGPIDRALNLSSINIHTAGAASPNLHIPHLEGTTVAYLRQELGQGVQASKPGATIGPAPGDSAHHAVE